MSKAVVYGLTAGQTRLLHRHGRGLARLARVLSTKVARAPTEIMFVVTHERSNVGSIAGLQLGLQVVTGSDAIIVPGLTRELPTWIARLALAGPVYDCMSDSAGIAVVVIDEHNEMALCRLPCLTTADSLLPENRSIIQRG